MQTNNTQAQADLNLLVEGRVVRPYPEMVERLFKNLGTDAETLHHATTGMAGETAELLEAFLVFAHLHLSSLTNGHLENTLEELGDWRFYFQKVMNIYGWEFDSFVLPLPGSAGGLRNAIDHLIIHSGAILDLSKKDWIYGKEVDARHLHEQMEHALAAYKDALYFLGWSDNVVCDANRAKLAKRYPEGVYTNEAAIARADKV